MDEPVFLLKDVPSSKRLSDDAPPFASVETDLGEIWYYVATQSGNADIADRLIVAITDCILLLANYPHLGRARDEDLRIGLRSVRPEFLQQGIAHKLLLLPRMGARPKMQWICKRSRRPRRHR